MDINYIAIGKRIRQFRKERGWRQATLAEKSGVEPSNISHIERAATKVSLPTLINIANALEVWQYTIDKDEKDFLSYLHNRIYKKWRANLW